MSRLQRDVPATIASLRMTTENITVFVESDKNDVFVYDKICSRITEVFGLSYALRESREVMAGDSGGKSIILKVFEAVRDSGLLKRTSTCVVFILDKDIDDFTGRALINEHIIYTPAYHCENILVHAGDLRRAIIGAFSLTENAYTSTFPNLNIVLRDFTLLWKSWVQLCLVASLLNVQFVTNYRVSSRVNIPPTAQPSIESIEQMRSAVAQRHGDNAAFEDVWKSTGEIVDALYSVNQQDLIFKGLWYAELFAAFLVEKGHINERRAAQSKESFWAILRSSLNVDHHDCHYISRRIVQVAH